MKLIFILLTLTTNCFFAQTEIKTYKVNDNLYMVGDRVFSLFYITSEGVVVIDPINDTIAKATIKSISEKTSLPIKYVIYSHNHWDHNFGGKIYKGQGALFIAHEEAAKNMTDNENVVKPDTIWNGNQKTIVLGKGRMELSFYGKNHGDGMTIFRFPELNALFTVDLVVPDRVLYAYLPDSKPKQWLEDLYKISQLKFDLLLMAHVRPIGNKRDLDLQINYFEDLYKETEKAINNKVPLFDIPTTVKLPKYKNLQNYNQWLHMNVWRILMEKSIGQ